MTDPECENHEAVEPRDYLRVIRERAWVIILSVVIVLGAALAFSYTATPMYRASAALVYQKNNLDQALFGSQIFPNNSNQDREIQTMASMVKVGQVAEAVKEQLDSPLSPASLLGMVSVKTSATTNVLEIQADSADPAQAANVANGFAEQFIALRQATDRATVESARQLVKDQLDSLSPMDAESDYGLMLKEKYESLQILEAMQNGGFTISQPASAPTAAFSPQIVRNAILGLFVGLVIGFGLAFLLDYLDKRVKDERTLEKIFGAPVLARIPVIKVKRKNASNKNGSGLPVGFSDHPWLLEPFRALRSSLQFFDLDSGKSRTILVTSGLAKEGKTTAVVNLGLSLALSGKRVILVEADMRRPIIPYYLGVDSEEGLSTVLAGKVPVKDALRLIDLDSFAPEKRSAAEVEGMLIQRDFYLMASGPLPPNPAELLASERMRELLETLSASADYVVIDTPPILAVADALTLAPRVDAVIVAARINSTTREEAQEVSNLLQRSGARVVGLVVQGVKGNKNYYYRKRGYRYKYT